MNESIRAWNARLAQYAAELPGRYPGAEVELYDTATWLDEVRCPRLLPSPVSTQD